MIHGVVLPFGTLARPYLHTVLQGIEVYLEETQAFNRCTCGQLGGGMGVTGGRGNLIMRGIPKQKKTYR